MGGGAYLTRQRRGRSRRLGREVRQHAGEGDAQGAPAVGAGEAAGGRGRRSQGVLPAGRPLLLGQKRGLRVGRLHPPVKGQRSVGAVAESRAVLLVEAPRRTAAEGVASRAAPRGAVAVGGRVNVRVVRGRRVVAVVQGHGVLRRLSAAQGRVAGQDGMLWPGLARR